jgi:hypothetical protein
VADGLVLDAHAVEHSTRTTLEEALDAAVDEVLRVRRFVAEREPERAALEEELQALLGAPPLDG